MCNRDRRKDGNPDRIRYLITFPEAPVTAADRKNHDDSDQRAGHACAASRRQSCAEGFRARRGGAQFDGCDDPQRARFCAARKERAAAQRRRPGRSGAAICARRDAHALD